MKQQEYATGAARTAGGTADGRTGGAGLSTTGAVLAVLRTGPADPDAALPPAPAAPPAPPSAPPVPPAGPDVPVGPAAAPVAGADGPQAGALSPDPGLLRLARWFAEADPGTADDLCAASFGLYPARHFGAPTVPVPVPAGPVRTVPVQPGPFTAGQGAEVSWWHGPTAHTPAPARAREPRAAGGLRRARRDAAALPVVLSGAKPGRPGRHRKPELSRAASVVPQDRSGATTAAERRIAARLLLAHPLVTASGPHADGFPLIRRHRDWLTERFDSLLGYRLVVGPWHARLHKAGPGPGAARRLEHPVTGARFTPGGYAQLALALALLVDAPERLPLGRLLAAMRAADPGPAVPAAGGPAPAAAHRADLAMALAVLADWQVLAGLPAELPADRSAESVADPSAELAGDRADAAGAGVLTVDRELARAVPAGPPALADDAADLVRRAAAAGPGTAVRRRLAENPAVLTTDLTEEQRAWLREHRHSGPAALAEFLGLEVEQRAEGVALLDPAEELTDLALSGSGTAAQAALLLVERLVEEVRPLPGEDAGGDVPVPDALIDGVLGDIADEYGLPAGWRRDYLADRTALRRDALDLLHRMGLITPAPRGTRPPGWLLRAPAARYAPAPDLLPAPGTGRHSRPGPEAARSL
ncbi:DUF2398 family protein [Kitasatospora sp. NPDC056327]|uniref:DUF2398 family protein n=1 Tax=Kitasatospora sp. NPDC056327 TaxID=3345785 RepID=UPI0035D86FC0